MAIPRPIQSKILFLGIALIATGCGSGSSSTTTASSSTSTGTNTTSLACAINESGSQNLVYTKVDPMTSSRTAVNETLAYRYAWSCSSTTRTLSGNGVPNHAVTDGEFATKVSAQTVSKTFTLSPTTKSSSTDVMVSGYAINSVKFDPNTAGTCPNSATTDTDCNYAMGSDTWKMEAVQGAVSPWKFDFGTDTNNAHVQPTGEYHYHAMPNDLIPKLNSASTTSMTLVGFAVDGFPIYANYGYKTATEATSELVKMKGSYQVKTTPDANRPSTSNFPLGHFKQDWDYVAGLGDLDECNGRTGVTPEYPNGTYHYYITESYPFIQRCIKGEI